MAAMAEGMTLLMRTSCYSYASHPIPSIKYSLSLFNSVLSALENKNIKCSNKKLFKNQFDSLLLSLFDAFEKKE
ncbi:MAG: hypothetical protein Q8P67_27190, partial [archaeon]|nr:hypothetical protein [archaeon]